MTGQRAEGEVEEGRDIIMSMVDSTMQQCPLKRACKEVRGRKGTTESNLSKVTFDAPRTSHTSLVSNTAAERG